MIVKIMLSGEGKIVLPKSYNHVLQAFFYRNMDSMLSRFLHDIGFMYGKRKFKLFTFSKVIGRMIGKNKQRGFVFFEPEITLYFASPLMDIISSSVKTFLRRNKLSIGKNNVYLSSIELVKPEVDEDITVRCLSPITVYRTPVGSKEAEYLTPWHDVFYELLKKNLIKKYEIIHGRAFKDRFDIEPVNVLKRYKKKVVYRGKLIEAWEGYYRLKGNKDIVKLALDAGLGARNSQGFGMVERVM